MTSLQPRIQRQMWVVDEKYHHIYTVAAQIGLPAAIVLALFDKHYPAECFGTLSESEWEVVLEGTGMEGRSSEIFQLIEEWKQAAKIGPDQSIIPPLEANAYVFQIKGDDEETDPEEQNIPNHSNLSQVDVEDEPSKDVIDQVNKKNLSGEADDGTMAVKKERLVENPLKEVQPVVDLQASDDSEMEDNCTSAASAKSVEPTTSSAAMVSSGVLQQRCEQVQNVANILFFSPDDLSALLAKTEIGLAIVQSSSNGPLSKDSKRDLSSIIANHHILCHSQENNCRLTKAVLENYVHCIKLRFPAETEDMVTYYIPAAPPERKNPGGSIYQAYKRLKGAKRDRQRRELQHAAKLATKENNRSPQRAEQSEADRWLTLNNAPWETVMKMWKITESSRFEQMKSLKPTEIITKFRHYAEPLGYQLIDEDYHSLGFSEGIQNWTELVKKLKPYFILKVHDEFSTTVLEYLNRDGSTDDVLVCCTLILLNCCVKPCKINKNTRPAILTAQEDVLLFAANVQNGVDIIQKLFESYAAQGIAPHPKVIAIGSSYKDLSGEFYVVFDRVQYKLNSAARAVDVVVKMCNVMNLPFSKVTKLVWYTVEEILYNIRAPAQYKDIEIIKKLQK